MRVTRHGPILTSIAHPDAATKSGQNGNSGEPAELPLALRWIGLEQCNILEAIHKLSLASNWEEFRDSVRDWDVPAQNIIFADDKGNIGYIMAGAIPMRAKGQALLPSPGWTGEYEWTGLIPFDELPQTYNPEQHFIVTANNRVVNDDYPHYITNEWLNGYRAQRIRDLLTGKASKGKLAPSDMAEIQSDQYALPAVEIVPHMLKISTKVPLEKAALDILRTWDKFLSPDSAGAAIYTTFLRKLESIVFGAVFGDNETLMQSYLGIGSVILAPQNGYASRNKPFLIRLLNTRDDSWFANTAIPNGPHSWDTAVAAAFTAAIEELREKLGENSTRWQYGKIHKMTYSHPIGIIKPLDKVFNRGPFPIGGDIDTVNMGSTMPNKPEVVVTVPSYRQIVNLADIKSSLSIHAPGQSGHPASKHYDDFIKLWLRVEHHPMLFDRSMIEANAEGTILLMPQK